MATMQDDNLLGNYLKDRRTKLDAARLGYSPEFPFSILNQTRTDTGSFANARFERCFESKGLSTPPQRASSASR